MPTCTQCKQDLPDSSFYTKNLFYADGKQVRYTKCKQCTKTVILRWKAKNKKKVARHMATYHKRKKERDAASNDTK